MLGCELEAAMFFPQSFTVLAANATKNLFDEAVEDGGFSCWQAWSAGNLCFKQVLTRQLLHAAVLENVRTSLQRGTGHFGFFFFVGSQSPDFSCLSMILFSSSPSHPVVSTAAEQASQTTTLRLLASGFGQLCDLPARCSKQNACNT